mmetsp:Transcript_16838/g.42258  ORF Transcript_16838/g.42258 Transcript_16838/m.42258 type:complete len:573 (-) Transcript_16838:599-2317(-)
MMNYRLITISIVIAIARVGHEKVQADMLYSQGMVAVPFPPSETMAFSPNISVSNSECEARAAAILSYVEPLFSFTSNTTPSISTHVVYVEDLSLLFWGLYSIDNVLTPDVTYSLRQEQVDGPSLSPPPPPFIFPLTPQVHFGSPFFSCQSIPFQPDVSEGAEEESAKATKGGHDTSIINMLKRTIMTLSVSTGSSPLCGKGKNAEMCVKSESASVFTPLSTAPLSGCEVNRTEALSLALQCFSSLSAAVSSSVINFITDLAILVIVFVQLVRNARAHEKGAWSAKRLLFSLLFVECVCGAAVAGIQTFLIPTVYYPSSVGYAVNGLTSAKTVLLLFACIVFGYQLFMSSPDTTAKQRNLNSPAAKSRSAASRRHFVIATVVFTIAAVGLWAVVAVFAYGSVAAVSNGIFVYGIVLALITVACSAFVLYAAIALIRSLRIILADMHSSSINKRRRTLNDLYGGVTIITIAFAVSTIGQVFEAYAFWGLDAYPDMLTSKVVAPTTGDIDAAMAFLKFLYFGGFNMSIVAQAIGDFVIKVCILYLTRHTRSGKKHVSSRGSSSSTSEVLLSSAQQ